MHVGSRRGAVHAQGQDKMEYERACAGGSATNKAQRAQSEREGPRDTGGEPRDPGIGKVDGVAGDLPAYQEYGLVAPGPGDLPAYQE